MKNLGKFLLTPLMVVPLMQMLTMGCRNYDEDGYEDNSPTSGKLKVYYDEGMHLHVKNQAFTFKAQYPRAHLELYRKTDNEAVQALFRDSCESIVISRQLSDDEKKAFRSRNYYPKSSGIAYSGIAMIANAAFADTNFTDERVFNILSNPYNVRGQNVPVQVLFDKSNSSVMHYLSDSLLRGLRFSSSCRAMNNTVECIRQVVDNENTIAFIDFAWLSDSDDSIVKTYGDKMKFIKVNGVYPSQTSFKTGNYPFTRTVWVYRKVGDYSLAKGFESFVAGPSGQLIFLKQGLLPYRQSERLIKVKTQVMETGADE